MKSEWPRPRLKLEDLQDLYWSSERAEAELIPLVLFKGSWSLGKAQAMWNLAQALKAQGVGTIADAARWTTANPAATHAAGLHLHQKWPEQAVGQSMRSLMSRVRSANRMIDKDTHDFLMEMAHESRAWVLSLEPIAEFSPWATVPWRLLKKPPEIIRNPNWPYLPEKVETVEPIDGVEMLLAVDSIVPKNLPPIIREEVCQDMVLAILEGEITREELAERRQQFIKGVFKRYPLKYGHVSLDAPMWSDSGKTLHDVLTYEDEYAL